MKCVISTNDFSTTKCIICQKDFSTKRGLISHLHECKDFKHTNYYSEILKQKNENYNNTHTFVKCMICGKVLRNISNTHLKKHNITQQEYKIKFPNSRIFADGLLNEQKSKREETIDRIYPNRKDYCSITVDKYIDKYGIIEGSRLWSEHKLKLGHSLDNYIKKYGQEIGLKKYKECCENLKGLMTLDWYINRYGKNDGEKLYKEHCKKISDGHTLEYYINKYGLENGNKKWLEICNKKSLTLDNFIRKYENNEGIKKFHDVWKNKFNSFTQSEIAIELFNSIILNEKIKDDRIYFWNHPKEFGIYCHSIDRYCFLDFYDLTRNKIIEFNGNYWHANPLLFESDSIINFPNKTYQKACDIWKSDQVRLNAIKEEMNCEILVIWESDFNKNKEKSINDCISFLLKES